MKKRQRNNIIIALVVLVLLGLAYVAMANREKSLKIGETSGGFLEDSVNLENIGEGKAEAETETEPETVAVSPPARLPSLPKEPDHLSTEEDVSLNADLQVFQVTFTNQGYSPVVVKVKKGDIVQFTNESDEPFWPASDPHPSHVAYPGFDAKQSLLPLESFQFQFNKIGSFGYHDHLHPESRGVVEVGE